MVLTYKDIDSIHDRLCGARDRKRTLQIAKLQVQIKAESQAYEAYCDGVYDALREVKNLPAENQTVNGEGSNGNTTP